MSNFPNYQKHLSFNDEIEDGVIRSDTESGTIKQRQRYAKTFVQSDISLLMTTSQLNYFITWYKTNKALPFTFTDPRTNTSHTYKLAKGVPKWDLFSKAHKDKWELSFTAQRQL